MHCPTPAPSLSVRSERGVALIIALMATLLLSALGMGLVMTSMTETMITNNYRDSGEAMYAADAGIERVMQDLLTVPDWNGILAGGVQSSFIDGAPTGERVLHDGSTIDLGIATNMLNCNKATTCSAAEMNAWTEDRPYETNNPRWQLFAYSPLADVIETGTVLSPMYVAVWIADDPAENDGNPAADGDADHGGGILLLRAQAFGPNGSSSLIEVTVERTDTSELERGYTGQRGQDEQNRRARKKAVGLPGKALTRSDMTATGGTFAAH
jgi:PilX N-terminal